MGLTGHKIISLGEIGSTQTVLREMLDAQPLPEGTVVFCRSQVAGRGAGENIWESEPGANLLFSLLWQPVFLPVSSQFLLTQCVSLAVSDFVGRHMAATEVSIKWPNDIYAGKKKIAGILIENSVFGDQIRHCIVGIGFNLNQTRFSSSLPNPVSLSMLTGQSYDIPRCLKEICGCLDARYTQLKEKRQSLKAEYLSRLFRFETWADFRIGRKKLHARISGVNRFGMLQLQDTKGEITEYDMKSVQYIL